MGLDMMVAKITKEGGDIGESLLSPSGSPINSTDPVPLWEFDSSHTCCGGIGSGGKLKNILPPAEFQKRCALSLDNCTTLVHKEVRLEFVKVAMPPVYSGEIIKFFLPEIRLSRSQVPESLYEILVANMGQQV